jgi:hypothetical protein
MICGKPILFQKHITCGRAQNVAPPSNTVPRHKLQIPLLQVHRASCSWAKCRPDAGKCPENMLGQFFPKYWNIGRTTIFVSSVTWFNLLNYSICSALPEMLFRRCELSRIHQNIGIQTFQLRWTCDLMRPDAADCRAQQGMIQLTPTSTA